MYPVSFPVRQVFAAKRDHLPIPSYDLHRAASDSQEIDVARILKGHASYEQSPLVAREPQEFGALPYLLISIERCVPVLAPVEGTQLAILPDKICRLEGARR